MHNRYDICYAKLHCMVCILSLLDTNSLHYAPFYINIKNDIHFRHSN